MGRVTFASTREIKILTTSLPDKTFRTVGIRTDPNQFELLALDESMSTVAKLEFFPSAFSLFDISGEYLLCVQTDLFTSHLHRAFSGYYEEPEVKASLLFQERSLGIQVDVEGRSIFRRTLRDIPSGTKELPKLPERNGDASFTTEDASLLRQAFDAFADTNEIHLQIQSGELTFTIPPFTEEDTFRVLSGDCQGDAQSTILKACLDSISKVHNISYLQRLRIDMVDRGLSRFEYEFDSGRLLYWVVPIVP